MLTIGMVAGELSGDTLGADLIREIKKIHPDATFIGIGGPQMQAEGLTSLYPLESLSVFGLFEVLSHLSELFKIRDGLVDAFEQANIDLFIGVDAPDFNLRLSRTLKDREQARTVHDAAVQLKKVKTVQYVSPSVWAWRQGRVVGIAAAVDMVLCLLPFEAEFYAKHDVKAVFVGHPLARQLPLGHRVEDGKAALGISADQRVIGLLPGSRSSEVGRVGEVLLQSAGQLLAKDPTYRFFIPAANEARLTQIQTLLTAQPAAVKAATTVLPPDNEGEEKGSVGRRVMAASDVVMLASGTATLEALLLGRPMVVVAKLHWLSYFLAKLLVKIDMYSLPNILAGRRLVPELIQYDASAKNITREVSALLQHPEQPESCWQQQHSELEHIHNRLLSENVSSAAAAVLSLLS